MKILAISATMDPISGGGNAERTLQLCRSLRTQKDIDVSLLTLDIGLSASYKKELSTFSLCAIPCINQRFGFFIGHFKKIAEMIRKSDVIHIIGHWSFLNLVSYFYIRKYKKPYLFCPAGAYFARGRSVLLKNIYNLIIGKSIINHADCIIAVTDDEARQLKDHADANRLVVIPNGINTSEYKQQETNILNNLDIKIPYLLFLGRLNEIKGPDLLLTAFNQLKDDFPEYSLVLAGPDDGLLDSLKEQVEQYRLHERVIFTGHVSGATKSLLLHEATCLVIPSLSEAMSIVILEAGMGSTPAIFTDQCGLNTFAQIGGGLEVPVNSTSIYKGLTQILELSDENRAKMGKILNQYVCDNYSWDRIVIKYINAFNVAIEKTAKKNLSTK